MKARLGEHALAASRQPLDQPRELDRALVDPFADRHLDR